MLFSFAFALYFLAFYVYGIKFSKKKKIDVHAGHEHVVVPYSI